MVAARSKNARKKYEEDDHHWDFLEEIDAPMWADLEAEAALTGDQRDDAWFEFVHPFHQCSSHQLIGSISKFRNGDIMSPELPDSVSRSRGKHYESRIWAEVIGNDAKLKEVLKETLHHPIRGLGSTSCSESFNSNTTSTKLNAETASRTRSWTSQANSGETRVMLGYQMELIGENHLVRPVVREKSRSSTLSGGLLSAVRVCMRTSYGTRHASRVEVRDGMACKYRNSSTSNSSIGSSVTNFDNRRSGDGSSSARNNNMVLKKNKTPANGRPANSIRKSSATSNASRAAPMDPKFRMKPVLSNYSKAASRDLKSNKNPVTRTNDATAFTAKSKPEVSFTSTTRNHLRSLNAERQNMIKVRNNCKGEVSTKFTKMPGSDVGKSTVECNFENREISDSRKGMKVGRGSSHVKVSFTSSARKPLRPLNGDARYMDKAQFNCKKEVSTKFTKSSGSEKTSAAKIDSENVGVPDRRKGMKVDQGSSDVKVRRKQVPQGKKNPRAVAVQRVHFR